MQFYLVGTNGLYRYTGASYLYHTKIAKAVLNNMPSLYNPDYQIFVERTTHRSKKSEQQFPIVYYNDNGNTSIPTKVLSNGKDMDVLFQKLPFLSEQCIVAIKSLYEENNKKKPMKNFYLKDYRPFYINIKQLL